MAQASKPRGKSLATHEGPIEVPGTDPVRSSEIASEAAPAHGAGAGDLILPLSQPALRRVIRARCVLYGGLAMLGALSLLSLELTGEKDVHWAAWVFLGLGSGALAGWLVFLDRQRARVRASIRIAGDALWIPRGSNLNAHVRTPLAEIYSVQSIGGARGRLVIGRRKRSTLQIEVSRFAAPELADQLREALERSIAQRDGDASLRAELGVKQLAAGSAASMGLAGLLAVIYLLEIALSGSVVTGFGSHDVADQVFALIGNGGLNRELVFSGQIDRIVTAVFLHGNLIHLLANLLVLSLAGQLLEGLIGRTRFLLIFLLSGLVASLGSAVAGTYVVHVGASGALYGLIGAWAYLRVIHRRVMPATLGVGPGWILAACVIVEVLVSVFATGVDVLTHGIGLGTGLLTTMALTSGKRALDLDRASSAERRALVALVAFCAVAAAVGFGRAVAAVSPAEDAAVRIVTGSMGARASAIHSASWYLARCNRCGPAALEAALVRMRQLVEGTPTSSEYRDTLARLEARLGGERTP